MVLGHACQQEGVLNSSSMLQDMLCCHMQCLRVTMTANRHK
jgi:hypothetical protein